MWQLKVKNLNKTFGHTQAVRRLSFHANENEITGIIGPNGSGKSTVLNIINALIVQDSGEVCLNKKNQRLTCLSSQCNHWCARTNQSPTTIKQVSVLDNIMLVLIQKKNMFNTLFCDFKEAHKEKARQILDLVGLTSVADRQGYELSYGQNKLLEIARAIAEDKPVILLDEPFAGLHPKMADQVTEVIRRCKQTGRIMILVDHNLSRIESLCDRIVALNEGKLLAYGTTKEVLNNRAVNDIYYP